MRKILLAAVVLWAPAIVAQEALAPAAVEQPEISDGQDAGPEDQINEEDARRDADPEDFGNEYEPSFGIVIERENPPDHERSEKPEGEKNPKNVDSDPGGLAVLNTIIAGAAALGSGAAALLLFFTLRASHAINRRQTRAYLVMSTAVMELDALLSEPFYKDRHDSYWLLCTVRNTGVTPSGKFCCHYSLIQKADGADLRRLSGASPYWGSIGPGFENTFPLASEEISRFIHEAAADGRGQILLTGKIEFETVYGETRTQDFHLTLTTADAARYIADFKEVMDRAPGTRSPIHFVPAVLDRE